MVGSSVNYTNPGRWKMRRPAENTRRIRRFAMTILGTTAMSGFASVHTANEAQAPVERVAAPIRNIGREQAFADFSRPNGGLVDSELCILCLDVAGVVVAHGGNRKLVGRNMVDVRGPDGRLSDVEVNHLGLTQGSGRFEYSWPNPINKRIELKDAYVLKVDDHTVCGSGFHKGASP
jgi:cytochrome c